MSNSFLHPQVAVGGPVHSVGLAAPGQVGESGSQALASLAPSPVLARTAAEDFFLNMIDAARELFGPSLDARHATGPAQKTN
jgi:hypothetical protein